MSGADLLLLERWRGGDAQAGQDLCVRHQRALTGFFVRRAPDTAHDLVQETWVECLRSQENFRGEASFRTFLFAVAHNVLRQHLRRRAGGGPDLGITNVADSEPSPASLVHRRFELATLQRAMSELADEHRTLLQLTYEEQLTSEQVGELLEVPAATVRTRLRRAKELLRDRVAHFSMRDEGLLKSTLETLDIWTRRSSSDEYDA